MGGTANIYNGYIYIIHVFKGGTESNLTSPGRALPPRPPLAMACSALGFQSEAFCFLGRERCLLEKVLCQDLLQSARLCFSIQSKSHKKLLSLKSVGSQ